MQILLKCEWTQKKVKGREMIFNTNNTQFSYNSSTNNSYSYFYISKYLTRVTFIMLVSSTYVIK